MKRNTKRFVVIAGIGLVLLMRIKKAFAQSPGQLSAEWEQWALSIPTVVNPLTDTTGEDAVVGQRGPVWFLAGTSGGGPAVRNIFVPEGTTLFFPVINSVNINTPNVCGQNGKNLTVIELRALSKAFIDGAVNLSVTLDGMSSDNYNIIPFLATVTFPDRFGASRPVFLFLSGVVFCLRWCRALAARGWRPKAGTSVAPRGILRP